LKYIIKKNNKNLIGEINLERSKSISNRVLIIDALCNQDIPITGLSSSDDTNTMAQLISANSTILDVGAAGTTMRFLTALKASQEGASCILTGSDRMKQRPIKVLVDALRSIGAQIDYLEKEGYPPIKITGQALSVSHIKIDGGTSSQYITALLLIAPSLANGMKLEIEGNLVSRSYVQMTLDIMSYFGINHVWDSNIITIAKQAYISKPYEVEADWSAASYWYLMASLSDHVDLKINGLTQPSLQGDSILNQWFTSFGVKGNFEGNSVQLSKDSDLTIKGLDLYFILCPDIAQSFACLYAGLGLSGKFKGLQTLRIKETDRTLALKQELIKHDYNIDINSNEEISLNGTLSESIIAIDTYEDHRMAMSFAPLAITLGSIYINDPMVVTKSYPSYWEDLKSVGFEIEEA
jgi:3-phosphoshikimate 1-carboxyvinyltransferase